MRVRTAVIALALLVGGGLPEALAGEARAISLLKRYDKAVGHRLAKVSLREGKYNEPRWGSRWHQTLRERPGLQFHAFVRP